MTMSSQMSLIGFCAAAMLAVAYGQLNEQPRDCENRPCDDAGDALILDCGIGEEVITEVFFAAYGLVEGSCPAEAFGPDFSDLRADDYNFTANSTCSSVGAFALVLDKCKDQNSCVIDPSDPETAALLAAGLEGCGGATPVFVAAVRCGDTDNIFGVFAQLVIALIGFALGCTVTVEMFKEVMKLHSRAVLVGWLCQFGLMPLVAYLYIVIFDVKGLVALGALLCGSVPGGTTSNLMCYYANGNVALSIIMSVASTVCALFMLPLLLLIYATTALGLDDDVGVPFLDIFLTLLVVIIPVSGGVYLRSQSVKWAKRCEVGGSILGLLFLFAAFVTGILQNPDLFTPSNYEKTWLGAALFQPIGALLGYAAATVAKLTGPELRAVILETGIQNYTIAIAIAAISFTGCRRIEVLTFVLTASFWYIINSFWLTVLLRWWSTFDSDEEKKEVEESKVPVGLSLIEIDDTERPISGKHGESINESDL